MSVNLIYGHIHVAKTGGTELNGLLASRYERVCGNKGYSYDFYGVNKANLGESHYHDKKRKTTRGKVSFEEMADIGYEDCDYVSQEATWTFWKMRQLPKRCKGSISFVQIPGKVSKVVI